MRRLVRRKIERPYPRRSGMTLLELLVAIAVVGLLLAVAIPAVFATRETSRKIQCRSRVGQLILACHSFEEVHGFVPTRHNHPYWQLLPYLDARPLQEALEAEWKRSSAGMPPPSFGDSVFCCPSDPLLLIERGHFNFLMNDGTMFRLHGGNGFMVGNSYGYRRERRFADITDGLSQTAAFSERLDDGPVAVRPLDDLRSPAQRLLGFTPSVLNGRGQEEAFAELCRHHRLEPVYGNQPITANYGLGFPSIGGYDHLLPPNTPGCANGPETGYDSWSPLVPATSLHPGGVNLAYADGHCDFVSDSIDTKLWRSIGTAFGDRPAE